MLMSDWWMVSGFWDGWRVRTIASVVAEDMFPGEWVLVDKGGVWREGEQIG